MFFCAGKGGGAFETGSAAAKTFLTKAYTAVTLRESAGIAGVKIGSVLNIFASREEILVK